MGLVRLFPIGNSPFQLHIPQCTLFYTCAMLVKHFLNLFGWWSNYRRVGWMYVSCWPFSYRQQSIPATHPPVHSFLYLCYACQAFSEFIRVVVEFRFGYLDVWALFAFFL